MVTDAREIEITLSSGISTGNNIQKEKNKLNAKLTVVTILHTYIYKMRHAYMEWDSHIVKKAEDLEKEMDRDLK